MLLLLRSVFSFFVVDQCFAASPSCAATAVGHPPPTRVEEQENRGSSGVGERLQRKRRGEGHARGKSTNLIASSPLLLDQMPKTKASPAGNCSLGLLIHVRVEVAFSAYIAILKDIVSLLMPYIFDWASFFFCFSLKYVNLLSIILVDW